eukprot:scaffold11571_cov74-Skeletonema_marinoi.AAC.1
MMKAILIAAVLCGAVSAFAPVVQQPRGLSAANQLQQYQVQPIVSRRTASDDDNNNDDVASAKVPSDWQSQILSGLSVIIDPDLDADI